MSGSRSPSRSPKRRRVPFKDVYLIFKDTEKPKGVEDLERMNTLFGNNQRNVLLDTINNNGQQNGGIYTNLFRIFTSPAFVEDDFAWPNIQNFVREQLDAQKVARKIDSGLSFIFKDDEKKTLATQVVFSLAKASFLFSFLDHEKRESEHREGAWKIDRLFGNVDNLGSSLLASTYMFLNRIHAHQSFHKIKDFTAHYHKLFAEAVYKRLLREEPSTYTDFALRDRVVYTATSLPSMGNVPEDSLLRTKLDSLLAKRIVQLDTAYASYTSDLLDPRISLISIASGGNMVAASPDPDISHRRIKSIFTGTTPNGPDPSISDVLDRVRTASSDLDIVNLVNTRSANHTLLEIRKA